MMTEFIRNHDRYLDPPDPPTHSECSNCGSIFDNDDLNETPRGSDYWLCDDCLEEHNTKKMVKCDGCGKKFHANEIQTIDFCYGQRDLCIYCEEAERKRRYVSGLPE